VTETPIPTRGEGGVPLIYELLEHAADLGFRVRAGSLPELFERAAEALVAIAIETGDIQTRESYPIQAEGDSSESLLVNWLSEVLYCLDGRRLAMARFHIDELTEARVTGEAFGESRDPSSHPGKLIVKGVTYHQLKIEHEERGWCCEVFLDV